MLPRLTLLRDYGNPPIGADGSRTVVDDSGTSLSPPKPSQKITYSNVTDGLRRDVYVTESRPGRNAEMLLARSVRLPR
jgi:hypothetical protein